MPNDPEDTMSVFIPSNPDRLPDTPDLAEIYCPVCEPPETIDIKRIVRPALCDKHNDPPVGSADDQVQVEGYLSGTSESHGESNRIIANLIRPA